MWVCSVRGPANAKERMDQIAAERPGRYFIFYAVDRTILAQTETFAKAMPERKDPRRACVSALSEFPIYLPAIFVP